MEAVRQLTNMGFSLWVERDKIRYRYAGPGRPDREQVRKLLSDVAANKTAAVAYLTRRAETPPPGLDEAEARRRHDQTLLELAEKVPRGFVGWARVHRPNEWRRLEDDYTEARLLILSENYAGGLTAMEQ